MLKWLTKVKYFLGWYDADWRVVWSGAGSWYKNDNEEDITGYCFYSIRYSRCRDMFDLICEGVNPKYHSQYRVALKKLAEYNNTLLEILLKKKIE